MKEEKEKGQVLLDAPITVIPLHVRGGVIIPQQNSSLTTTERWVGLCVNFLTSCDLQPGEPILPVGSTGWFINGYWAVIP